MSMGGSGSEEGDVRYPVVGWLAVSVFIDEDGSE